VWELENIKEKMGADNASEKFRPSILKARRELPGAIRKPHLSILYSIS
jgi:hypothetical protein